MLRLQSSSCNEPQAPMIPEPKSTIIIIYTSNRHNAGWLSHSHYDTDSQSESTTDRGLADVFPVSQLIIARRSNWLLTLDSYYLWYILNRINLFAYSSFEKGMQSVKNRKTMVLTLYLGYLLDLEEVLPPHQFQIPSCVFLAFRFWEPKVKLRPTLLPKWNYICNYDVIIPHVQTIPRIRMTLCTWLLRVTKVSVM